MEDTSDCVSVSGNGPKDGLFNTASTKAGELTTVEGETTMCEVQEEDWGEQEEAGEMCGGEGLEVGGEERDLQVEGDSVKDCEGEGGDHCGEKGVYQEEYVEQGETEMTDEPVEDLNSPGGSSASSYASTAKKKKQRDSQQQNHPTTAGQWGYTQIKLIVYGSREVSGKGLYCKFYHANRKHKTTPKRDKSNPMWNEWFPISHSVGTHSPVLTIGLWGSSLTGHSMKGFFEVDITPVLEGEMLDDYFPLTGCNGQIRVKILLMGASVWELMGSVDLTAGQAEETAKIHQIFPNASSCRIASVFRCHQHNSDQTIAYLRTLSPAALSREQGADNRTKGMHMSPEQREECVEVVLQMTPDVSREEIHRTLCDNDFVITRAVDELVKKGCTSRTEESVVGSPAYQLRKVDSIANTGGFISQIDQRTGEERILHQSVLRQGNSGLGRRAFDERRLVFEDSKKGGRRRARPMRVPAQGEICE
eukprot:GHVS01022603.1.p1 GENE.GHVS01022603.1~~GHVS01022603.1.p1  ORF type:complete len:477 (+),score=66.16 GHVS01022603.1:356-1786(+)